MPIKPPDDICLNKAAIVERCIRRIREEYIANPNLDDFTHIDAMTLNIERACQACIDLAMHLVAVEHLGMPQSSGDAFSLLARAGMIDRELERKMHSMTGFRNVAIHQYQELDVDILRHVAKEGWADLQSFCQALGLNLKV